MLLTFSRGVLFRDRAPGIEPGAEGATVLGRPLRPPTVGHVSHGGRLTERAVPCSGYSTSVTVALGCPLPALFTANTR